MHAINENIPNGPGLFVVTQTDEHGTHDRSFITNVRKLAGKDRPPGSVVISAATWLLVLLDAGLFYVSFDAQYKAIFAVKNASVPSMIEAAMLDAGMVILSALGIGLALAGKPSKTERFLIMACSGASAGMNFAAANPGSWRSVAVYVAAPVFAAIVTDRVISVIRRHVLPLDSESAWAPLGHAVMVTARLAGFVALYLLRAMLAPSETAKGVRRMVLDAAPIPAVITVTAEPVPAGGYGVPELPTGVSIRSHGGITPHLTLGSAGQLALCTACPAEDDGQEDEPPTFGTKREAFEWHYRRHPKFGDRAALSQVAKEIGERVGLQWGTARTYAAAIVAADAISDAMDAARDEAEEK
jgi:hypothetical protein